MAVKSKRTLEKVAVAALEDIKAQDIIVLDVKKLTPLYDTLVIAGAQSARQTKALAQHVRDKLKEAGAMIVGVEGEEGGEWVLVDAGDIVVHIMQPAIRAYYNLEELWSPPTPVRKTTVNENTVKKTTAKTAKTAKPATKAVVKKAVAKKAATKKTAAKTTVKKAVRKVAGKKIAKKAAD
ncbi:MAG: ribosome silencing factor [Burkholderiales bacterium]|jgi:ribosome-associated protein|nr:ribosome silencing factor [Burkholderiales bacterium]